LVKIHGEFLNKLKQSLSKENFPNFLKTYFDAKTDIV